MTDALVGRTLDEPHGAAEVVTIDPTSDPRWGQLLETRRSDVFHAPAWLRALASTYEIPIRARVVLDADRNPTAGFVYAPIDDIFDPRVVSLPFSDFCDPLVSTLEQWELLTDGLVDDGRRVQLRCLHELIPMEDARLESRGRARWHGIDLNRSGDDIWESIHPSARRSIRKARKEGVEVRLGESVDDMRAFFELHVRVRKHKYRLLAQPWRFFESLWDEMLGSGAGAVCLAYQGDELLGGVVFLEWDGTLYYKFNASDAERLGLRPNDLVIWHGIEHGLARSLDRFDFGLSDWDQEGLLRFKRKYATEEKTIHTLGQMPPGGPSERELEARALLPRLTDLFTDASVPDHVTEQAGDALYRYFT